MKYLVKFDEKLLEIIFFKTFVIRERQKTQRKEEGVQFFGREDKNREISREIFEILGMKPASSFPA